MNKFLLTILIIYSAVLFSQDKKFANYILNNPRANSHLLTKQFVKKNITVFKDTIKAKHVTLTNGYAKYKIIDKEKWDANNPNLIPYKIDIVFTKYPVNNKDWITNYNTLLANRLKELFSIDSTLNRRDIEFNIIMQVDCYTAAKTKEMFHGIVIYYRDKSGLSKQEIENLENNLQDGYRYLFSENKRKKMPPLLQNLKINDSIAVDERIVHSIINQMSLVDKISTADVYEILERHPNWNNMIVVMDWTGSMYAFSGQIILWHALNFKTQRIDKFVLFNDGNKKRTNEKIIGETGGIYDFEADSLQGIIDAMYLITQNGKGGDSPENDIEALIYAQNNWPNVKELFLIADNTSNIRDFGLLEELHVPVHVILCRGGFKHSLYYINLAYKTGGTIHTIDEDVETFDELNENNKMKVFGHMWFLKNGQVTSVFDGVYKNKLE